MELLFVILLVLLALGVGYYFLVRWAREKIQTEARLLTGELRAFENQYRQFLSGLEDYLPDDPEPYGSQARLLHQNADQIGAQLFSLREQYVRIQERLPHKASGVLGPLTISPFLLLDLNTEIGTVRQGLVGQQTSLEQVGKQVEELGGLGWLAAQQTRQAQTTQTELDQRLQVLRERRANGDAFDEMVGLTSRIRDHFGQIPEYFLSAEQPEFAARASKAEIIQVHQMIGQSRQDQEALDERLQEWEKRLAGIDEKQNRLRQGLVSAEQALSTLPKAVDSQALQQEFESLQTSAQLVQVQVARPELEKLPGIETAIDGRIQAAQELEASTRHARQGQAALDHVLHELTEGQKSLSDQYSTLGGAKAYRILWARTSNTLTGLNQRVNDLGTAERKRTPAKIEEDLESANQLALEQKELAVYLRQIADQQSALAALLEGPELSQAVLWTQNSQKLLGQIREYHPDNWPRADNLNTLPDDLRGLTDSLQRLGAGRPADGIAESQLVQRLQEAQRIGQAYQALRVRLSAIEGRLAELQQSEGQARESLETTGKNLTQIGFIVKSNPTLTKIAGQEIGRFQAQIDKQLAELDVRQQGTVDSKARQASGLNLRIEQGLNGWLDGLNQDTQTNVKTLTVSLTRLDSIAILDDAPAVEARRLLATGGPYGGSSYGQRPQFSMEALVMEFKRRSEYSQACSSAVQALQDLEKPVVESYTTASQSRQKVQDQFNVANNWLRQARAWPPVEVDVEAEFKLLGQLEADWAAVKEKPIKAIDLVKRLGDLAREYQALAGSLGQLIERGNREQKDIQKLENELDENLSLWEKLQKTYQDNPEASEDINQLLNEADQEMYRVKTQYREGTLIYTQVHQAIQSLHRKVRLYQAVLDDAHVIDVSGRVIASKESQRAPGEW